MNIAGVNMLPPENIGVVAESKLNGDDGFWYGVVMEISGSNEKIDHNKALHNMFPPEFTHPSYSRLVLRFRFWSLPYASRIISVSYTHLTLPTILRV